MPTPQLVLCVKKQPWNLKSQALLVVEFLLLHVCVYEYSFCARRRSAIEILAHSKFIIKTRWQMKKTEQRKRKKRKLDDERRTTHMQQETLQQKQKQGNTSYR